MVLNYDPKKPVYALPDVQHHDVALNIDPSQATVEGRMTGLLADNSDYMKMNEAEGLQTANQRGLLNTSMAVGAARKAAIAGALPIAQQDAKLYGTAGLNNQAAALGTQKLVNNSLLTGALTAQDYGGKYELQKMSETGQYARQKLANQGQYQTQLMTNKYQLENQKLIQNSARERLNIEQNWKNLINDKNLKNDQKKSFVSLQARLGAELTGGIERIMRDKNISNKKAAIKALMDNYKSQLSTAAAVIGIKLRW